MDQSRSYERLAPLQRILGVRAPVQQGLGVARREVPRDNGESVDDQVKIGGRRIELGEVEANVAALPNVYNSAVAVQKTPGGESVLVGYVSLEDDAKGFDQQFLFQNRIKNRIQA